MSNRYPASGYEVGFFIFVGYGKELNRALAKHEQMQAIVVPVIIRPVDWQAAPFAKFQALPKDGKPVTSWSNNDEAWLSVTKGLRKIIEEIPIEKSSIMSDEGLIKLSGPLKSELNRLNKIKQSNEIDLIVIDGLEYIVSEAKDRNREAEVFSIIKDLKNLVRQYDSPLILTVHVSQQVDQRIDRRPRLADLKDWELFVSDVANVVLFLYRDELYDPDSPNRGIAELIVGKNVNRQIGVLNLSYIRHLSTFSNIAASLNPENFE